MWLAASYCRRAVDAPAVNWVFRRIVHDRQVAALDGWLETATTSGVAELGTFAAGIRRNQPATEVGLAAPIRLFGWSWLHECNEALHHIRQALLNLVLPQPLGLPS